MDWQLHDGDAGPRVRRAATQDEGKELFRIQVDPSNPYTIKTREVYLEGQYGRLRTVANGPDGYLYLTTSNCDSRGMPNGRCAMGGDQLLRVTGVELTRM